MISYKSAKKILSNSKINIKDETINCLESLNRVSAFNVYSQVNYPSGNNAAFDGYAINSKETNKLNKYKSKKFKIIKTIAAGEKKKKKKIKKFEVVEIMTGALIPREFDSIIPIEKIKFYPSKNNKEYILINKKIKIDQHIRYLGSDYKKKEIIIKKGTLIKSSHILAFKTLGVRTVKVKTKPNILFFSTGNEISDAKKITNWKIRNSNSHYIKSLSNRFLFNFIDGGILRDKDEKIFKNIINKSLKSKIDIVITSGAVSAGKFDFVPSVILKLKLSNFFKGVAIRPGKPILFAKLKKNNKAIFGLPGNPISSAACFRFFVYPYLLKILGIQEERPFKALLKNEYKKNKESTKFLKGKLSSTQSGNLQIEILKGQQSYKLKSFAASNVWGIFQAGQSIFKKGQLIDCHLSEGTNNNIFF